MDAAELNEVCRLCPSSGGGEDLMHVFDERLSVKNNMKEVILVTTGVEIQETDLVSKKICQRCCTKTLQMFLFRQDALTQDRALKEKCNRFLEDKGIRLPNTCITIKRERRDSCVPFKRPKMEINDLPPTRVKAKRKKILHPSVADIYKSYPHIKLPKKCLERHLAPVVSFTMGEVEKYFKKCKLDMRSFIYRPGTNKPPSNAVAKKRTSFPTKPRTVSPIKICKKGLEIYELQNSSANTDYVCTSVHKDKHKKKSHTPSDAEKPLLSKIPHENKTAHSPPLTKLIETPKVTELSESDAPTLLLQPPNSALQTLETITTSTLTTAAPIFEESCTSRTSKPEFIESLGLTPTVTTTKSKTLHVCNLCGSVHNNAFKLKTHSRKHMVCQFCKLRFKSLETKQDHVDNSCQVKEIMNSPGPIIELEKIHLNLAIRKNFREAFSNFETIPGLPELDPIDLVTVKSGSPPPLLPTNNNVILLSDDEETQTNSNDLPPSAPTSSADVLSLETENSVYSTVSVVRPDVRIKNDTMLNNIVDNVGDKQIVKDLLALIKPRRRRTVEKVLQTDLPATKDIKINNAEGFCEFKNLKEQLLFYKIPVSITDGPFHVAYQYKDNSKSTKTMALWDDLPMTDPRSNTHILSKASGNGYSPRLQTNSPADKVLPMNSYVQSAYVSSSVPANITKNISGPAAVQPHSFSIDGNISTSATPLLQNFAQRTTPTRNNKPIPIPNSFIKSALGYTANTSKRSLPSGGNSTSKRPIPSNSLIRKSLPHNVSNNEKSNNLVAMNVPSSFSATNTGEKQLSSKSSSISNQVQLKTDSSSTSVLEASRFRVKNVWELQ